MKTRWDLDVISIAVALVSYLLAALLNAGVFQGGPGSCGTFGFGCGFRALLAVFIGTVIGTVLALNGLGRAQWRSVYGWIGLVLNGLPAVLLSLVLLLLFGGGRT